MFLGCYWVVPGTPNRQPPTVLQLFRVVPHGLPELLYVYNTLSTAPTAMYAHARSSGHTHDDFAQVLNPGSLAVVIWFSVLRAMPSYCVSGVAHVSGHGHAVACIFVKAEVEQTGLDKSNTPFTFTVDGIN